MNRTILACITIIVVCLFLPNYYEGFQTINGISDGWFINLDRSKDRMKSVKSQLHKLSPLIVTRWPAVDGTILTDKEYDELQIPYWSRPSFAEESRKKGRKGEIGCYLSHVNLLKHLDTLNTPPNEGHLILEDDIKIDDDFVKTWNKSFNTVPETWDMIFVGLLGNKVKNVLNGIGKPEWITGTHAYVVKHSSIPRILNSLKGFNEPIDEVYGRNLEGLKIYALNPPKIHQSGPSEMGN